MTDLNFLSKQFEENRGYLRGVAYRILGSLSEADDAVQECWLRLSRADSEQFDNLRAWLTTVVARICLDVLRSRKSKREDTVDSIVSEPVDPRNGRTDPEAEAMLADAVGHATLVVLLRLSPVERIAFVLHDLFDIQFGEIARITGRSPEAIRQIASRARRRVRGTSPLEKSEISHQLRLVERFLEALRKGDVNLLLEVLDPDAALRSEDRSGSHKGPILISGAKNWADKAIDASRSAHHARIALVNGLVGIILAPRGKLTKVLRFTFSKDRISEMEVFGDSHRMEEIVIAPLP